MPVSRAARRRGGAAVKSGGRSSAAGEGRTSLKCRAVRSLSSWKLSRSCPKGFSIISRVNPPSPARQCALTISATVPKTAGGTDMKKRRLPVRTLALRPFMLSCPSSYSCSLAESAA